MAIGLTYKIEHVEHTLGGKSKSRKYVKKLKHRKERHATKINPERPSEYGKYSGFEY